VTEAPFLRIVRGQPDDEQVAVLLAVLTARAGAEANEPAGQRWSTPAALVRTEIAPGPGAWWASALPR